MMTSFVYSKRLSWDNARAVCLGYGGDLVSIENEREEDFIRSLSSDFKTELLWIGLNDLVNEGQFVWSDGTYFNSSVYNKWKNGEPSHTENQDCVGLRNNLWNDKPCSWVRFYICERPKGGRIFCRGSDCLESHHRRLQIRFNRHNTGRRLRKGSLFWGGLQLCHFFVKLLTSN